MAEFAWTQNTLIAAQLVAEGDLTQDQIAERANTTRNTLYLWRKNPEFAGRVEEIREEFRQSVRQRGIAILEKRVEAQNTRWRKLQRVIDERANDPSFAEVPGWQTGLLTRDIKTVGFGPSAMTVNLFSVDTALLREIRELEKQAALEMGQWTEKSDGATGKTLAEILEDMDRAANSYQPERRDTAAS